MGVSMPNKKIQNNENQEDQLLYERYLKTTSKQAGLVFGTRIIGYFLGFAMQAILARFLGPDKYGVYSLGLTIANVCVIFGTFGLNVGMTKFLGEYLGKEEYAKAKGTIFSGFKWSIIFSSISALMIFFFREQIATNIFKEERLISLLPWFSIVLILLTLMNIFGGVLQGLKKPSVFVFYKEIIERAARIGLFLILSLKGIEVLDAVAATLLSSLIVVLRLTLWLYKNAAFLSNNKEKTTIDTKKLLSYSSNMLFVTFTYFLMGQVNRLIIGGYLGSKQVGYYVISDTIARLAVFFLSAFIAIFNPIVSELYSKKSFEILKKLYTSITRFVLILSVPIILWIIFFSKGILTFFGEEFIAGKNLLVILAITQLINIATGPCGVMMNMTNHEKIAMINGLIIAGLNLIFNFIFIPLYGILGSALASALAIGIVNIITVVEVHFLIGMLPYNWDFIKIIISSIITSFFLYYLGFFINGFVGCIFGLLFGYLLFALCIVLLGLSDEDKRLLKLIINKFTRQIKRMKE